MYMVNVQVARHSIQVQQPIRTKKQTMHAFQCSISTVWSANNIVMLDTIKSWQFPCAPTSCCGSGASI